MYRVSADWFARSHLNTCPFNLQNKKHSCCHSCASNFPELKMFDFSQSDSPAQFYHDQRLEVSHTNHSEERALAKAREMLALLGRQNDPDEAVLLRAIDTTKPGSARSLTLADFKEAFALNQESWNLYLVINRGGNKDAESMNALISLLSTTTDPQSSRLKSGRGLDCLSQRSRSQRAESRFTITGFLINRSSVSSGQPLRSACCSTLRDQINPSATFRR